MSEPQKERYGKSLSSDGQRRVKVNVLEGLSEGSERKSGSSQSVDLRLVDVQQEYQQLKIDAEQGR